MNGQIIAVEFVDGYLNRIAVHVAGAKKPLVIVAKDNDEAREIYEHWTNIWENPKML